MAHTILTALVVAVTAVATFPATAQQAQPQPQPFREVTEGVFQLDAGGSMDLTDQKVLLTYRGIPRPTDGFLNCLDAGTLQTLDMHPERLRSQTGILLGLDGLTICAIPGSRINLKSLPSSADLLRDKKRCTLDVVGVQPPRENQSSRATFRLNCA